MPNLDEIKKADFHSEREVETKFIIPLLDAIGYQGNEIFQELFVQNVEAVEKASGKKVQHRKPDFIIFDSGRNDLEHSLLVIEAKSPGALSLQDDYDAMTQAWAYAKALAVPRFCTANGDEFVVYQLDIFSDDPADSKVLYAFRREDIDKSTIQVLKSLIGKRAILALREDSADELKELRVRQANMTAAVFTEEIAKFTADLHKDILGKISRLRRQDPKFAKSLEELENDNIRKLSDEPDEDLALRAAYDFLFKLIFAKIYEDKGYSNGIRFVPTFLERKKEILQKPLPQFVEEIVQDAFNEVGKSYSRLFQPRAVFSKLIPSPAIIAEIVEEISLYNFKEVTNDMLGDVYHRALIAEVSRREKGSFFTPKYIVDEIIKSIPIEELDPKKETFAAADIFCGSGTFLLGLYDRLKEYHRLYVGHSEDYVHEWIIKRLYGNDIDPFATMLSIINLILRDDMHRNGWHIAQGDSFKFKVFSDFADERSGYSAELLAQYGEVFNKYYDLIISNPPYGAKVSDEMKANFRDYFKEVRQGGYDTYRFAIYEAVEMLKPGGYMGFIVPNTWLTIKSAEKLRKYILKNCRIVRLVNLQQNVFNLKGAAANVDTMLVILQKNASSKPFENDDNMVDVCIMPSKTTTPEKDLAKGRFKLRHSVRQGDWRESTFNIWNPSGIVKIIEKIDSNSVLLGETCTVITGIKPHQVGKGNPKQTREDVDKHIYLGKEQKGNTWKPFLKGREIGRYEIEEPVNWINFGTWLAEPKTPEIFESDRLVMQKLRNPSLKRRLVFTWVHGGYYNSDSIHSLINFTNEFNPKYILAVLNSELLNWYFIRNYKVVTIQPHEVRSLPIRPAPPEIQAVFAEKVDMMLALNAELVRRENTNADTVGAGLKPARTGGSETLPYESWPEDKIKKAIAATDGEIDRMVYDLYGLTEDEIAIVEDSAK